MARLEAGNSLAFEPQTADASPVVKVAAVKILNKGGCAATAGAATAAGIGIGTVAVIGGMATAETVGSLPGQSESAPSASR